MANELKTLDNIRDLWFLAEEISEQQYLKTSSLEPKHGGRGEDYTSNWEWSIQFRSYAKEDEAWRFNNVLYCEKGRKYYKAPEWMWKIFAERVPDTTFERGMFLLEVL